MAMSDEKLTTEEINQLFGALNSGEYDKNDIKKCNCNNCNNNEVNDRILSQSEIDNLISYYEGYCKAIEDVVIKLKDRRC